MNWGRGLMRAWVVFTVLWILRVAVYRENGWYGDPFQMAYSWIRDPGCAQPVAPPWCGTLGAGTNGPLSGFPGFTSWGARLDAAVAALAVPLGLLALGAAIVWVILGFRRKSSEL